MLDLTAHPATGAVPAARTSRFARLASSLRVRLLALVLLAVAPTVALILYNAWEDRGDARDDVRNDALTLTELSVMQQQQLLEGSRQLLVTLSPLASSVDLATIDRTTFGPTLATFLRDLTFYANLGIADAEGNVICSAASAEEGQSITERASFQGATETQAFAVGRYVDDPISGARILDTSSPIVGPDGATKGVVFLDVDLGWLSSEVAGAELPAGATFTIVDGAGTVLVRYPDSGLAGQPLPDDVLLARMLTEGEGTVESDNVDGTNRLYAYTRITEPAPTDLYAVVGVPTSTAYAAVNTDLERNLAALGIVALMAVAAAWLFSDLFVIRQTRRLVSATERLSAGDLGARSGLVGGSSEIGTLARAFDEMAARLEQRSREQEEVQEELLRLNESLEQRVEERTQEVQQQSRELRQSNSELEDFTYVVSHDLKEPLRGIEAFSGFLAQDYGDRLDDEGRRYLGVVRESAVRMKDLIEDLLELSRVGRAQVHRQVTPIGDVVREVTEELRYAIEEKGAQVRVAEGFPDVMCDRVRIKEVFRNLISNAVKFNDRPDGRVEVGWEGTDGKYRFTVSDNGIGIDPEYHEKVFQIFQRLVRREDYPGTGAGLSIVKKIVEMHGGDVGVESAAGAGSTFWFTIGAPPETGDTG
jgi:signal transduction histidine kinase